MKNLARVLRKQDRRKMKRHRQRLRDDFNADDWFTGIEAWMLKQDRLMGEHPLGKFSRRVKRGWRIR